MIGDQYADALGLQVMNDLLDIADRDRVDACKGFVKKNELGCRGQGAGYLDAASFATGQAHAEAVTDVVNVKLLQQAFEGLLPTAAIKVLARFQDRHNVVGYRQLAKDRGFLRQIANTGSGSAVHGQVRHVLVVDQDPALIRFYQTDDHVEAGGLAGTIWAQQAHDLAAFDGETDITHDLTTLIALS